MNDETDRFDEADGETDSITTPCAEAEADERRTRVRPCKQKYATKAAKDRACAEANCPLAGTNDRRCSICDGPIVGPRSCHKCKYSGKAHPVCCTCQGPAEESNCGISYVHLEDLPMPGEFVYNEGIGNGGKTNRARAAEDAFFRGGLETGSDAVDYDAQPMTKTVAENHNRQFRVSVEGALRRILANLMAIEDTDLLIFKCVYHGMDMVQTAKALGLTKQVVWARLLKMCRRNKVVTATISGMRRAGAGGAKRGVRRDHFVQDDLFSIF